MFEIFLTENNSFRFFGMEHLLILAGIFLFGFLMIKIGRRLSESGQTALGTSLAGIILFFVFFRILVLVMIGDYNHQEELPLHLCRILPFFAVWMMFKRNRFLFGILYFYIVVGTLNALLTPDLAQSLPNYSAFIYWIIHGGLVILPFYCIFVYEMKPNLKDLIRAIIYIHVYLVGIHLVNLMLGSNYFFTMAKPEGGSLLDYFGPWPWYILAADLLMWFLFALVYLPFYKKSN